MPDPVLTIADLTVAQTRAGMARFAPNWLPCKVEEYHPPAPIDGTPFPASVTVAPLLEYIRVVPAAEDGGAPVRLADGERILKGEDAAAWAGASGDTSGRWTVIARPYDSVRVPVLFGGSPELALTVAPRVGDVGILMLAGRSIADALAAAAAGPVLPEFMPNPLRLSDGMYTGHLLFGDAIAPPEGQPAADTAQLGPRDARAATVYLRLGGSAWTLEGETIKIGESAVMGAARMNDTIAIDAPSLAALNASLAAVFAPPVASLTGTVTGGSGTVTIKD